MGVGGKEDSLYTPVLAVRGIVGLLVGVGGIKLIVMEDLLCYKLRPLKDLLCCKITALADLPCCKLTSLEDLLCCKLTPLIQLQHSSKY